jgi:hypothetical protein
MSCPIFGVDIILISISVLPSSAKRSSNELDLTLSTTKMFSPLALISALNSSAKNQQN